MRLPARPRDVFLALFLAGILACTPWTSARAQGQPDPLAPELVQAAIYDWLAHLLGPAVKLPRNAITVARAGDHDQITFLADALSFGLMSADRPIATATIRPVGGTWSVDDIHTPSPLRLDLHPPGHAEDLATITLTFADQAAHALIDPTDQTESTIQGVAHGVTSVLDSRSGHQIQHMESLATQFRLRPGNDARADIMAVTDTTGYSGARTGSDGTRSEMAADRIHVAGHVDGVDITKLGPALQSAITVSASIASAMPAQGQSDDDVGGKVLKAIDRPALDQLLALLPGIVGGFQLEESADGISFDAFGEKASLTHFGLGMNATAPDGILQTKLDVALDGLAMRSLPPDLAGLLPRHVTLRPTITGVNLIAALAAARQPDPTNLAIFGPNGVVTSIDRFSMDIGPATLTASGHVVMRQDQPTSGTASISIVGFDALMDRVNKSPMLQQAAPIFILAKGMGRQDGENLVWDVSYEGGAIKVNGTDMSAMIPQTK